MPHRSSISRRTMLTSTAAATATVAAHGTSAATTSTEPRTHPDTANGRLYEIRHGSHSAVIAGVAATLLSWQVDGVELLLTHSASEVGEGYQGKTILPWPNRIDHGRYQFDGQRLRVPLNEPERQAALHGLMTFVEWSLVEHRSDRVTLEYALPPHYGYPFRLRFLIEYTLRDDGLRCRWRATNVGTGPAPFGTANHTYLAASGPAIDSIRFTLPANTYYLTNDRLIPTGTAPVHGTEYDFRRPRPLGETSMDTAFTDLTRGSDGTAVVRFERPDGHDVELWVDATHDYLQVYTDDQPETDRPARAGITVEPMTCAPNAFVSGDGLFVLRPGRTHQGSWGYRVPR